MQWSVVYNGTAYLCGTKEITGSVFTNTATSEALGCLQAIDDRFNSLFLSIFHLVIHHDVFQQLTAHKTTYHCRCSEKLWHSPTGWQHKCSRCAGKGILPAKIIVLKTEISKIFFFIIFDWLVTVIIVVIITLGAFSKLRKKTISFVVCVRPPAHPHATTRLPVDGFWLNLIFEFLSKVCRANSSFTKFWQE